MELLTYAFAKTVQGAVLRVVLKWDMANGCLKFIVGDGPNVPGPRGLISVELNDVDVEYETKPFQPAPA